MPKNNFSILDILKGVVSLVLILFVLMLAFGLVTEGSVFLFDKIIGHVHPLIIVALIAVSMFFVAILSGFSKTLEAGFNPYKLFEKFKNNKRSS